MSARLELVNRLMEHWRAGRTEAFVDCFTDDLQYHYHMGSKPVNGKATLRKFVSNFGSAYEQRVWRLDSWAENADLLLVEGYEELYDRKYDRIIRQPFMQAYEFRGDKIAKLRDYYEPANLKPPAGSSVSALMSVIERLQDANLRRDKDAVLALVTPDIEYHFHVGSKVLQGVERVGRFLDRYWEIAADLEWRIDRWAQNGDKLLVEGYEEYTDTRTGARVAHPYMGIFEFRDGRIARWRDYFEMDAAPAA